MACADKASWSLTLWDGGQTIGQKIYRYDSSKVCEANQHNMLKRGCRGGGQKIMESYFSQEAIF